MYILVSDFMASLRPGRCYNKIKNKPWTRFSKSKPRRSYVKGIPASKIHQFETGAKNEGFTVINYLVSESDVQLRSNCLESARISVTKYLTRKLGETGFFLKILVYPHHVLRENAMATGAGADRLSQGMRHSFGRPKGQAARVSSGQRVIMAKVAPGNEILLKEALRRASAKLSGSYKIK